MAHSQVTFLLALTLPGCGAADDQTGPGLPQVCAPGKSEPCAGPAGCAGGQVCSAEGTGFGACHCDDLDAGDPRVADLEEDCCPKGQATGARHCLDEFGERSEFHVCLPEKEPPVGCIEFQVSWTGICYGVDELQMCCGE